MDLGVQYYRPPFPAVCLVNELQREFMRPIRESMDVFPSVRANHSVGAIFIVNDDGLIRLIGLAGQHGEGAFAGEQTGEVQKKFSKRIPSAARRSMLGV